LGLRLLLHGELPQRLGQPRFAIPCVGQAFGLLLR
jgi:hypothetical protein